jgi:hypothetical protein
VLIIHTLLRNFVARLCATGKKIRKQNVHKRTFSSSLFQRTPFPILLSSLLYSRVVESMAHNTSEVKEVVIAKLGGTVYLCGAFSRAFGVQFFGGKVTDSRSRENWCRYQNGDCPTANVCLQRYTAVREESATSARWLLQTRSVQNIEEVADAVHANLSTDTRRVAYVTDLSLSALHGKYFCTFSCTTCPRITTSGQ